MAVRDLPLKTIVIFGITDTQGSSVATTFLKQPRWKLRGVTRNPFSPAATQWQKSGVEIDYGDLDDPTPCHLKDSRVQRQAVESGKPINAVAFEHEIAQDWALIDAMAASLSSLERFVFSTLSSARNARKGAIDFNLHFDSKAEMLKHLKDEYPELWAKTSLLTLGCCAGNWKLYKDGAGRPEKTQDGSYKVYLPMNDGAPLPFVEPKADTGPFVQTLLELPPGFNLVGAGSHISWGEWCNTWGPVNGVECTFERQDRRIIEDAAGVIGREVADMYQFFEEYGYCGVDEHNVVYPWDLPVKVKYTTMEEYIWSQDWSSVLHPESEGVEAP